MSTALAVKTIVKSCLFNVSRHKDKLRLASTYKAASLKEAKSPLVLEVMKRPKLKKTEVRVQVAYCSVNSADVHSFREGTKPLPFVPGYEFSGEIIEVGKKVPKDEFNTGEKVTALNLINYGGLAEECVVDMSDLWKVPTNLNLKDAAAIVYGHAMALYGFGKLTDCISEKDIIVVSAGVAGLGLAAVDVAAGVFKKKVLAVTDTEKRSELTREKGAFKTMHFNPNLSKDLVNELDGKSVDIVYDAVGGHMSEEMSNCVSANGKIFQAYFTKTITPPPPHSSLTVLSLKKLKEQSLPTYRQIVTDTLEMANDELISAHISETFSFKDVNKAIEFVEGKLCTGKVLVKID